MPIVDSAASFGYWVRRQRKALDLTQAALARRVGCATVTISKIEQDQRRPSRQMTELLAVHLALPADQRAHFLAAALGEDAIDILTLADQSIDLRLTSLQTPVRSNLPAPTTPLVGRENELARLTDLLGDPNHRLVTILGPGGMGKSRLAFAACHAIHNRFPDGVFLVELVAVTSGEELIHTIANVVNCPFQDDPCPPRQQLLDYLIGRKLMLLLDNFEHLLDRAELLIPLLEAAPDLCLLVTSRERLHLQAETIFRLDGLTFPSSDADGPNLPHEYGALELFIQSAQRTVRDNAPGPDQWPAVVRICRMVDGMPLGILLAASWVEHLTPGEIADEIAANITFLGQDLRDLDPRHRRIEAVFEQSWQRLTDEEQHALMGLSIFAGSVDRDAANAVADAPLPVLTRLVDKCLLWRLDEGRYNLHELIRQLAHQKLTKRGAAETRRALHSRWFLSFAARQEQRLKGGAEAEAIRLLAIEKENIRMAWQWAADNGEIAGMLAAVEAIGIFYNRPGLWTEGEVLMESAIATLGPAAEPERDLLRAWLWCWHGCILHSVGKPGQARLRLTEVLERLTDDALPERERRRVWAFAHLYRGGDLMTDRQRSQTGDDLRCALALFEDIGDDWWTARTLCQLGYWETFSGDLRQGKDRSRQAAQLARRLESRETEIKALVRESFVAESMGLVEEGEQLAREALVCQSDPSQRLAAANRLAFALLAVGKTGESVALARETIEREQSNHLHIRDIGFVHNTLARGYLHLGRFAEAKEIAQNTVHRWANAFGWEHPFVVRTLAMAVLALGDAEEADRLIRRAFESEQQMGNENLVAVGGACIDCCYPALALGHQDNARQTLIEGMRAIQRSEAFHVTCKSLPAAARILAELGKLETAATLNGSIQRYPYLINSRWYATVALEQLAELIAPLPAELRAAAEARGRTLELPRLTTELLTLLG